MVEAPPRWRLSQLTRPARRAGPTTGGPQFIASDGESGAGGEMAVAREHDPPARCPVRENAVSHTGGIYGRITSRRKRHDKRRT